MVALPRDSCPRAWQGGSAEVAGGIRRLLAQQQIYRPMAIHLESMGEQQGSNRVMVYQRDFWLPAWREGYMRAAGVGSRQLVLRRDT